jgi:hypothetical protein
MGYHFRPGHIESPHPPAPSPKFGRRGAGAKSGVSCLEKVLHLRRPQDRIFRFSLSQTWERAGVRAFNDFRCFYPALSSYPTNA